MICPRSHSKGRFSATSMLCSLPCSHFPPKRPSRARSFPFCLGGLGQEMERSLEIFIEGMNNGVAKFLPSPGFHPLTEP